MDFEFPLIMMNLDDYLHRVFFFFVIQDIVKVVPILLQILLLLQQLKLDHPTNFPKKKSM